MSDDYTAKSPEEISDLILVGTVHLDPEGREVLNDIIEFLRPKIITVEISAFSVRYRSSHCEKWLRRLRDLIKALPERRRFHTRLRLLDFQLRTPFEWDVAQCYGSANNTQCLAVDTSNLARDELPQWKKCLLSRENLLRITEGPEFDLDTHFKDCYSRARIVLKTPDGLPKPVNHLSWLSDTYWKKREWTMADRIRRIHGEFSGNHGSSEGGSLVHICGWMHLVTGSPWKTMTDLLSDMSPTRILLNRGRDEKDRHLIV